MYQLGCWASTPLLTFAVRYTALVAGSYTGVEVTPMFGVRSPQPRTVAGQAGPRLTDQVMVPVAGFRPYTSLFSVATTRLPPATSGCA